MALKKLKNAEAVKIEKKTTSISDTFTLKIKINKEYFFVIMITTLMKNQEQVNNQSILNKLKMKSPYITHALYSLIENKLLLLLIKKNYILNHMV